MKKENSMFKENMIAPCGLDCSICSEALKKENPCVGCLGESDTKPEYCSSICKITTCEFRQSLPDRFCDQCPQYPCKDMVEKEVWYANAHPLVESPMGNLGYIRKEGMEKFLKQEKERWTCAKCGGIICVHTGMCSGCGEKYTVRSHKK